MTGADVRVGTTCEELIMNIDSAEVKTTRHGKVLIGKSEYSEILFKKAKSLTLVKPENEKDGFRVTRYFAEPIEFTNDMIVEFSEEAAKLL
jgi:flavin-dependent dehydrogenase